MGGRILRSAGLATAALALAACGAAEEAADVAPLEPAAVSGAATGNLRSVLTDFARASRFAVESDLLGVRPALSQTCLAGPDGSLECQDDADPLSSVDIAESGDDAADWLGEVVLPEEQVELREADRITYRLDAATLCGEAAAPKSDAPGGPIPAGEGAPPQPEEGGVSCEQVLDEVPVRIEARSPAAGDVELAVLVGAERVHPVDLRLFRDELSLRVDLSAVRRALELLAGAAGEDVSWIPAVASGVVQLELHRYSALDFILALDVIEAVELAGAIDGDAYGLRVAEAAPALAALVDGDARTLVLQANLAAIDVTLPLDWLSAGADAACGGTDPWTGEALPCELPAPADRTGSLAVHVGGVSGIATLSGEADTLELAGVGLGDEPTVATFDGRTVLRLDVNAAAGRRLDATLRDLAGGLSVEVEPEFELALALDLAPLAEQLDVPAWAIDEDLRLTLDGAPAPRVVLLDGHAGAEVDGSTGSPAVRVEAGRLSLTASDLLSPIVVEAGMCLLEQPYDDGGETEQHPFAGYASGSCP